jgi:hypothetical protein
MTPVWEKIATFACEVVGVSALLALITLNPEPSDAPWTVY